MKDCGDFINRLHIFGCDHRIFIHIAEESDFCFNIRREQSVGSAEKNIRLDTYFSKFFHTMLSRFGL